MGNKASRAAKKAAKAKNLATGYPAQNYYGGQQCTPSYGSSYGGYGSSCQPQVSQPQTLTLQCQPVQQPVQQQYNYPSSCYGYGGNYPGQYGSSNYSGYGSAYSSNRR